jgi:MerR HTH family regulatory protein
VQLDARLRDAPVDQGREHRTVIRFALMSEPEPLLTSAELARQLHVAVRTVQSWVEKGILTPTLVLPGGARRYRLSDVERQLRELQQREDD